jgi:hypothetical protein
MKKAVLISGVLICILLIGIYNIRTPKSKQSEKITTADLVPVLKDGDIICRLGDRIWSLYFKDMSLTDKRFSHLGVIRVRPNQITVINAEGRTVEGKDFVNEVNLDEFLDIARAIGIYRIKGFDGTLISAAAMDYKGYPFDWKFDLSEEGRLYCSELPYVILKRIAPEIHLTTKFQKEIGKDIVPLEAFSNSDYFEVVLYVRVN